MIIYLILNILLAALLILLGYLFSLDKIKSLKNENEIIKTIAKVAADEFRKVQDENDRMSDIIYDTYSEIDSFYHSLDYGDPATSSCFVDIWLTREQDSDNEKEAEN